MITHRVLLAGLATEPANPYEREQVEADENESAGAERDRIHA
jgi:hypothetical protein